MGKSIREIAKLAATWWGEAVSNPKFDNGDNGSSTVLVKLLASANTNYINTEKKEKFIYQLSKDIENTLAKEQKVVLSVDYHPCKLLYDAAIYADIPNSNFPWKTIMWITKNKVSVCYGYKAPEEFLYATKAFWENQIKYTKEKIENYKDKSYLEYIEDENERKKIAKEAIEALNNNLLEYENNFKLAEE